MNRNRLVALLVTMNLALLAAVCLNQLGAPTPEFVSSRSVAAPPLPRRAPNASERRTEIVEAAERVSPSIVSIGASRTTYYVNPFADFFSNFTVYPYQERIPYLGSGVVVDPKGLIVTNYHVVQNAEDVFVTLMDGREMPGKVLDADTVLDIALVKIEGKDLPAVKLGDSSDLLVGEWVLAMGNPFGNLIGDPRPTVTVGVVSALKRSFRALGNETRVYQDMIQTDAAINPGNSGGALINCLGELVGINTFIMSKSGGAEGIGFAIPVNRVKAVIEEILMHGKIRSRLIDFRMQNVNPRVAKMVGAAATKGAIVSELMQGGPADRAGFRVGDIITSVDDRPVKDAEDVALSLWSQQVGTKVRCEVDRRSRKLTFDYVVTEASSRP